ncbi:hypothetical protein COV20_01130 [Candidatus Woesearchaeota archaeon CG10_big_fil_rev_8_21_14_0_10_45_16]|nr:MAG: hypothetical protein COV20_01130 [Candidatus Woesearchaeota archaeon CG10_big_fil_rev_8_21_14_0_10_45_16]
MAETIETIITDLDHTIIDGSTFDLFSLAAGIKQKQLDLLKARFRRDPESIHRWGPLNALLLRQRNVERVLKAMGEIPYTEGVEEFFRHLPHGVQHAGILTSSIDLVAEHVRKELGLDFAMANELPTKRGIITGRYTARVPMGQKLDAFKKLCDERDISLSSALYVGDNDNDQPVIKYLCDQGGYTAAFRPYRCPELEEIAHITVDDFTTLHHWIESVNTNNFRERSDDIVRAVGVVIEYEQRVVVVYDNKREIWTIPSGRKRPLESFNQAAAREGREETGLEIDEIHFVEKYVRDGDRGDIVYKEVYAARPVGELTSDSFQPLVRGEIGEVRLVPLDEIINKNHLNMPEYIIQQLRDYQRWSINHRR